MHEKVKDFLGKTGTSHATEHELNDEAGQHHTELGEFEKKAFSDKHHHTESEL